MQKFLFLLAILFSISYNLDAQWITKGDSIIVQTFTFDSISTRSGVFKLPKFEQWEKVLMHYTLKCDPKTPWDKYNCGEWDYLTYTVVRDTSGRFDSTEYKAPNFRVGNSQPTIFNYTTSPTFTKFQKDYVIPSIKQTLNTKEYLLNENSTSNGFFTNPKSKVFFTQNIISLNDLTKLAANKLSGISINLDSDFPNISDLRIRLLETSESSFQTNKKIEGIFTEVLKTTDVSLKQGRNDLVFAKSFNLSQTKNLLIEITYEYESEQLANNSKIQSYETTSNQSLKASTGGKYINLKAGDYIDILPSNLKSIKNEMTIAFWQNGDLANLPANTSFFEAWDSKNQRAVNIHLPWSNSNVYWDCGNSGTGSYDRINKEAALNDFAGKWNHWAFVKNTNDSTLKIYLNGILWHEGKNLTRFISPIVQARIGSNGSYFGKIDDFTIMDKALNSSQIQDLFTTNLYNSANSLNPKFTSLESNILVYANFDEQLNNSYKNVAKDENSLITFGYPQTYSNTSKDIYTNFEVSNIAINFNLIASDFELALENKSKTYSQENPANALLLYNYTSPNKIVSNAEATKFSIATDTISVWFADQYEYTFNENNKKIDSIWIEKTNTINKQDITWYSNIVDYEIDRFITPYGINLDLGPEGFTWIYDVTDFAQILSENIQLSAANTQELLDLKFIFIKGTPARNLNKIQYLWKSGGNSVDIEADKVIAPIDIKVDENSKMFKIKTRSSGHGFAGGDGTYNCGEFCERLHNIWVDNAKVKEWNGWQECGDNPVFPQGGTWLYDRADWCPAKEANTYNYELSQYLTPGKVHNFDYDMMPPGPNHKPYGNYVFTGFLVSYSDYNFNTDASIEDILAPSTNRLFSRFNPICGNPIIKIANSGRNEITSIEFEYGIVNGKSQKYNWSGNLATLAKIELALPPLDYVSKNAKDEFFVRIKNVNGSEDEYNKNNYAHSEFIQVDKFGNNVEMLITTNNSANEQYKLTLTNSNNEIVYKKGLGEFESKKSYIEKMNLPKGCYSLEFENVAGVGLDYWPIRAELGSGSFAVKSGIKYKSFISDFGNKILFDFIVSDQPFAILDTNKIYLDSVNTSRVIKVSPKNEEGILITKVDLPFAASKGFKIDKIEPEINPTTGTQIEFGDTLFVTVTFTPSSPKQQRPTLYITTNDFSEATKQVEVWGNFDFTSSVDEETALDASIFHNIEEGKLNLLLNENGLNLESLKVNIYDLLGNELTLSNSHINTINNMLNIDINSLKSGNYFVKISNDKKFKVFSFIVAN